jgi:hypothetical protein
MEVQQRQSLEQAIVPGVRRSPGVVSATWTFDHERSRRIVLITYASRGAAEAMVESIRGSGANQAAVGLELVSVQLLEVEASI